jgi:hypothetical protein
MKTNTSNYQQKEAHENKNKIELDLRPSSIKDVPVQIYKKDEAEVSISEPEIEEAIDDLNPDKSSMESRG